MKQFCVVPKLRACERIPQTKNQNPSCSRSRGGMRGWPVHRPTHAPATAIRTNSNSAPPLCVVLPPCGSGRAGDPPPYSFRRRFKGGSFAARAKPAAPAPRKTATAPKTSPKAAAHCGDHASSKTRSTAA